MDEGKEKLESRLKELEDEFNQASENFKSVQAEIADKQRLLAAIRESQLRIQGAFAELKKQLAE